MEINGKFYHDPAIQLKEIDIAVSRLPSDSPLRPYFEFLIGYVNALNDEMDLDGDTREELNTANNMIEAAEAAIDGALDELGVEGGSDFENGLARLIDFAMKKAEQRDAGDLKELLAVQV
jgi:hypothetical protein